MLTVVGQIVGSELKTYQDRRTGRPAYRARRRSCAPTARRSGCRSSPRTSTWPSGTRAGCRSAAAGSSSARSAASGTSGSSPTRRWCCSATPDEDAAELSLDAIGEFYPIYPLTKGVDSWDLQRAVAFALTVVDDVPDLLPGRRARATTTCSTSAPRSSGSTRPHDYGQITSGAAPVPVRGGAGHPARAGPPAPRGARARRPGADRRAGRAARGVRRAAAVRAHRRAARDRRRDRARPGPAAPDEPAAPGRGRLRQDAGRAAGDAARRRLRRPGGAARADRGARPAAPPLDHRAARRPRRRRDARRRRRGDQRRAAHRLDDQGPAHRADVAARDRRGRAS